MSLTGLEHLVTIDPEVVSGTPVFRGTRVPIKNLFDYLSGSTLEEFLDGFPSVSREQTFAVIDEAAKQFLALLEASGPFPWNESDLLRHQQPR